MNRMKVQSISIGACKILRSRRGRFYKRWRGWREHHNRGCTGYVYIVAWVLTRELRGKGGAVGCEGLSRMECLVDDLESKLPSMAMRRSVVSYLERSSGWDRKLPCKYHFPYQATCTDLESRPTYSLFRIGSIYVSLWNSRPIFFTFWFSLIIIIFNPSPLIVPGLPLHIHSGSCDDFPTYISVFSP